MLLWVNCLQNIFSLRFCFKPNVIKTKVITSFCSTSKHNSTWYSLSFSYLKPWSYFDSFLCSILHGPKKPYQSHLPLKIFKLFPFLSLPLLCEPIPGPPHLFLELRLSPLAKDHAMITSFLLYHI